MRALSLWQPWASAIALGLKRIETRGWWTRYRGPIAVHAAKRWTADEREIHGAYVRAGQMPSELPFGALVATAVITDVLPSSQLAHRVGTDELAWGNYGPDRFGFILDDIKALAEPIPFVGRQGFFEVPDELFGLPAQLIDQGVLL